ncbi:MAG: CD225/dispanin family protein [Acidimicrobiales bacterium]|nr:CD225/dispanin family protein [Acidimicrobiales bacterium]
MSSTPPGQTPAGWYPDPNQPGMLRYWDGSAWTEHTNQQSQVANPGYQTYAPGMTGKPTNHLVPAILTTIFCCLPFGIVSIVKASQVNNLWDTGQYVAARKASEDAKKWWLVSLGVSLVLFVGYFVLVIALGIGTASTSSNF